jgi:4-hydroxymandelate oxidase
MLADLIGELVPPDQPADALILGFALPDVRPERATAAFLSHVCPGRPVAFAVCDQGCAAGFTALRLARDYAGGGGHRVLVALAEQARLDYDPPAPVSVPARAAGFAMLCDARPAPGAGHPDGGGVPLLRAVRVCPGVPAGQVLAVLRHELAALPDGEPGEGRRALVLGEGLAPLAEDGVRGWRNTLPLPPGQPLTGTWRELAAWTAAPGGNGLAIADYDPGLRYLCLAEFTV